MNVLDPNGPGFKTVFKINNGKLPYSRNAPDGCGLPDCEVLRLKGDPPLQICGGCKSTSYCTKEHQKAHWREHKPHCKAQREQRAIVEGQALFERRIPGLPTAQERKYLLEDWAELHRKALEEAMAWVVHEAKPKYDYHKRYFHVNVAYRPESDGNPSLAFKILDASLQPLDLNPATMYGQQMILFLQQVDWAHNQEIQSQATTGYLNAVPCKYVIAGGDNPWITASYIDRRSIPKYRPGNIPFYQYADHCSQHGVVFRLEGLIGMNWVPGLMHKHSSGTKWVWKKQTEAQLKARGIDISRPEK